MTLEKRLGRSFAAAAAALYGRPRAMSGRLLLRSAVFAMNDARRLGAHARLLIVLHRAPRSGPPARRKRPRGCVFFRFAVNPEAMSPGMTAQTLIPKGRTSFCSAST